MLFDRMQFCFAAEEKNAILFSFNNSFTYSFVVGKGLSNDVLTILKLKMIIIKVWLGFYSTLEAIYFHL